MKKVKKNDEETFQDPYQFVIATPLNTDMFKEPYPFEQHTPVIHSEEEEEAKPYLFQKKKLKPVLFQKKKKVKHILFYQKHLHPYHHYHQYLNLNNNNKSN